MSMTLERAAGMIECLRRTQWEHIYPVNEALKIGRQAILKQIPTPLKCEKDDLLDIVDFYCPVCKQKIISRIDGEWIAGRKQRFCDNCGQALDWSDSDE